ncbi:hypothetical protein ABZY30_29370 [Streptomyces massasporeus]|uniref:hypothetical protein n=1 Tax=Streptomyces massasporeus TaxID=67324 RepID=UPI0033B9DEB8
MQALPPSAALVELKGALRYHGTGARHLAGVLRVRTISCLGVDVRVGLGPTVTVAATASAQVEAPGGVLAVDPDQAVAWHQAVAWLASLPVETLHGIVGPRQAAVLRDHGVHNLGLLAAISPATVQRLMGGRAGRLASTAPAASTHARSSSARPRHRPYGLPPPHPGWRRSPRRPPRHGGPSRAAAAPPQPGGPCL